MRRCRPLASGESEFEFVPQTPAPIPADEAAGGRASGVGSSAQRPLPLLRRKTDSNSGSRPAFPFVFECLLHPQNVTVADHTIVVGRVIRALSANNHGGGSTKTAAEDLCLTYANTHFWKMGSEI